MLTSVRAFFKSFTLVAFAFFLFHGTSSGWGAVAPTFEAVKETGGGGDLPSNDAVSVPFDDDSGDSMWESSFLPDSSYESAIMPDQDGGAMEAIIATAKARAVLDNPDLSGEPTAFEQIKSYMMISGATPESVGALEGKARRKIVSLGSYPTIEEGGGGESVVWGEFIQPNSEGAQVGDGWEALVDLSQDDPWKAMIEDGDFCLYLPFFTFNPTIPISVDAQTTRKIIYKIGQPVRVADLFETQGISKPSEFFLNLQPAEDASITAFLLALRDLGSFPPLDEQFDNTLRSGVGWVKARTVRLIWKQPDGETRTVEILAEVEGEGARDIRGVSFSNDVQWLVDLLGKAKNPSEEAPQSPQSPQNP